MSYWPSTLPRGRWRPRALRPAGLLLATFLALPVLGLLARGLLGPDVAASLSGPIATQALRLSLGTSIVILVIALALGSPLALMLARRRVPGGMLIETLVDLPMLLPPAVAGLGLLLTFGRRGLLGPALADVGIEIPFTSAAVILAGLFVASPFYVRAARAGFAAIPREIEEAAMVEGASGWQVFRHVTAPLALPALAGGAVMCWARALGEFGATIMFAGSFPGRTQTMPLAIYAALETDLNAAIGLSLILLATSFLLLVAFRRWLRLPYEPFER